MTDDRYAPASTGSAPMLRLRRLITAVLKFATISGLGLLIDFGIFYSLVRNGVAPGVANLASAAVAVTFVYFTSVAKVFSYRGGFLLPLFLVYALYQAAAVSLASFVVGVLAASTGSPMLAKLIVLPATFSTNFICMWLLTRQRPGDVGRRHEA